VNFGTLFAVEKDVLYGEDNVSVFFEVDLVMRSVTFFEQKQVLVGVFEIEERAEVDVFGGAFVVKGAGRIETVDHEEETTFFGSEQCVDLDGKSVACVVGPEVLEVEIEVGSFLDNV
jgi:hypothetical protein